MKHPFIEQDYYKACIAASSLIGYIEGMMRDEQIAKFYPELALYADNVADTLGLPGIRKP
jgi:hypothetical protein